MNEEQKKQWFEEQAKQISLVTPEIIPMTQYNGFFFKVNNIEIPESLFKKEFDTISKCYFSVIEKIKTYNQQ
jgi:hypothetical protein